MADDVTKSLQVTGVSYPPGLPHDAWPVVTTVDMQNWYLSPATEATCDGVPVDASGLIAWTTIWPCEVVMHTAHDEYHAVKVAAFTSKPGGA